MTISLDEAEQFRKRLGDSKKQFAERLGLTDATWVKVTLGGTPFRTIHALAIECLMLKHDAEHGVIPAPVNQRASYVLRDGKLIVERAQ